MRERFRMLLPVLHLDMGGKMRDAVLEIKDLSKSFGKNKVLHGINLAVRRGTVMGLMGENGAGKSTMMKCLFGIYAKDGGQIFLDGKPVDFFTLETEQMAATAAKYFLET